MTSDVEICIDSMHLAVIFLFHTFWIITVELGRTLGNYTVYTFGRTKIIAGKIPDLPPLSAIST